MSKSQAAQAAVLLACLGRQDSVPQVAAELAEKEGLELRLLELTNRVGIQ